MAGALSATQLFVRDALPVTFISECECSANHGVSRWGAKTDTAQPPLSTLDIQQTTPAEIYAWQGPGEKNWLAY